MGCPRRAESRTGFPSWSGSSKSGAICPASTTRSSMTTATREPTRRAIGIVRVSETNGRKGQSFASPAEQRERVKDACKRDKLRLVKTIEELDVSGGTPLERRDGLRQASRRSRA